MLLLERLIGKHDILVPYFDFSKVLRGNMESFILKDIYKLRYDVYCLECGYLEAKNFDECFETDDYDGCSVHFAAYTLKCDIVATLRMVIPKDGRAYPFESRCTMFEDFEMPARGMAAEISRLVVRKSFRRRRGDSMEGFSNDLVKKGTTAGIGPVAAFHEKRGNSDLLLLGMYREMYRHSRANGIQFWYAAMERSRARSLEKMGFKFLPVGPQVDHHGAVMLHIVDLNDLDERLRRDNKFLAAWFNDERISFWVMLKTLTSNVTLNRFTRKC